MKNDMTLLVASLTARLTLMFVGMLFICSLATPSGLTFQEPNRLVAIVEILMIGGAIMWLMVEGMGFADWLLQGGLK